MSGARPRELQEDPNSSSLKRPRISSSRARGYAGVQGKGQGAQNGVSTTEKIGSTSKTNGANKASGNSFGRARGYTRVQGKEQVVEDGISAVTDKIGFISKTNSLGKASVDRGQVYGEKVGSTSKINNSRTASGGHGCLTGGDDNPYDQPPPPQTNPLDVTLDHLLTEAFRKGDRDDDQHVEGSSSSFAISAAATATSRRRRPSKRSRGKADLKPAPKPAERKILEHGKHHIYRGTNRTLMTCIFKTYHTKGALYWKQWKKVNKDECWRKFMEYFILGEGSNETSVKLIFLEYGRANWSKWLYCARFAAKKIDPNFVDDPEGTPPPIHKWLGEEEWRQFCKVWRSDEWKKMAAQAKANRNLEKEKLIPHCGKTPLEERLANEPQSSILRGLEISHKNKEGEWTSSKAKDLHDDYRTALEVLCDEIQQKTGVRPSPYEVDQQGDVFIAVTGGASKGRLVVLGRAYTPPRYRIDQCYHSDTSDRLRLVEEELRKAKEREEEKDKQYRQLSEDHRKEMDEQRRLVESTNTLVSTLMSQLMTLSQYIKVTPPSL